MAMRYFTDMIGSKVEVNHPPQRIISLVPSQTELLYDLGLDEEVVGITKFCVHPQQWFRTKKRVGGTKTVHSDIIAGLQPDLIIANKEENTREQVEALSIHYPTWVSDIRTVADGLRMIREVGVLVGKIGQAETLVGEISRNFEDLKQAQGQPRRAAYLIWRKPWMCAGGDTFISNMITQMGWENVLAGKDRYPEITLQELAATGADTVMLSSEPYPFKEPHIEEIRSALPDARIILVDGEMFSWYGSRMKVAAKYLASLLQ